MAILNGATVGILLSILIIAILLMIGSSYIYRSRQAETQAKLNETIEKLGESIAIAREYQEIINHILEKYPDALDGAESKKK